MNRKSSYKTRQQECILSCLSAFEGQHVTVSQMASYFKEHNVSIGITTIYRQLDKLMRMGLVQKYVTDSGGACFQYCAEKLCKAHPQRHFHLRCLSCGRLVHVECEKIRDLQMHIRCAHDFEIQPLSTTFYGKCSKCMKDV